MLGWRKRDGDDVSFVPCTKEREHKRDKENRKKLTDLNVVGVRCHRGGHE
jgi:hypothetical protein